ncbi:hypothetical protein NW762_013951 [Fusarium torreyae]|uniref:FAD-binding FR-type domain-containing protein n=1 Tax=Fusarium torreyae TaxID=1237075 RepID=A0A9W8V9Z1_9HYPO|nr:hypothetical protein NW762_013951 [Fusarium torreyae]
MDHDSTTDNLSSLGELKHVSSTRLTPSLSLHTFSVQANNDFRESFRPGQHLTLQFPSDLDPISGSQTLSHQDRRLSFTPYHAAYAAEGGIETISLIARDGRVTGLLGLPRPNGPMTAKIIEVAGGIPPETPGYEHRGLYIAGGTGIAPFIAMATDKTRGIILEVRDTKPSLICSIRGEDFQAIEYLWNHQMLLPQDWNVLRIYITPGNESGGFTAGKSRTWWYQRFKDLAHDDHDLEIFRLGRMEKEELSNLVGDTEGQIVFCGSKQLEWQVKMWLLGKRIVHSIER